MRWLADVFLFVGAAFCFLGSVGLLRMPDVYNRIQVGTKTATLGALSVLLGVGLLYPDWWPKLVAIGGLILVTNPVGSSTLARALYRAGAPLWRRKDGS